MKIILRKYRSDYREPYIDFILIDEPLIEQYDEIIIKRH